MSENDNADYDYVALAKELIAQGPENLAISLRKIENLTGEKVALAGEASKNTEILASALKLYVAAVRRMCPEGGLKNQKGPAQSEIE